MAKYQEVAEGVPLLGNKSVPRIFGMITLYLAGSRLQARSIVSRSSFIRPHLVDDKRLPP
jgi:hypothetical protein